MQSIVNTIHSKEPRKKNVIALLVDGLHLGFLGAYGNGEIATPSLNAFASESVLFDRFYANTTDLSETVREYWFGLHPATGSVEELPDFPGLAERLRASGYRTILVTDDPEISLNLFADGFSEVHLLETPAETEPAATPEQTGFFRLFATVCQSLAGDDRPYFLWAHSRGFAGPWDFPNEYRLRNVEEGDPEPYPGVKPPRIDERDVSREEHDPDRLRSVVESYEAGIAVLDESFGGLLDFIDEEKDAGNEEPLVLFGAFHGFPLGEHGWIGRPNESTESTESSESLLWAENVHLPMILRFPDRTGAMFRTSALVQPIDIYATLCAFLELEEPKRTESSSPDGISREIAEMLTPQGVLPLITGKSESVRDHLLITEGARNAAIVTPEWFLRESGTDRLELYVKPDDRWEINEVADRCEADLERLVELLNTVKSCAATSKER